MLQLLSSYSIGIEMVGLISGPGQRKRKLELLNNICVVFHQCHVLCKDKDAVLCFEERQNVLYRICL